MNKYLSSLAIATILLFFAVVKTPSQRTPSPEFILQKTASKLAVIKALGYTYTQEFNYPSENYLLKSTSAGYLDLKPRGGSAAFKYHFTDDDYIAVYNGSESFLAVKKKKIIVVTNNPPPNQLAGASSLYNSPLTLKYALPKIAADKSISKQVSTEIVDGRRQYVVEFSLHKAALNGLGEIRELRDGRTSIYRVVIDAATFLPREVRLSNGKNKDFTKTTFTNMTERPKAPVDSSWYFSSYTNEYKLQQPENKKLIEVGKTPPDFVLKEFASNSQVSLEKYRGKVVLMEFWIVHCNFCIAAVPKLNEIAQAYKADGLELVSINIHDDPATIASFKKRYNPEYMVLVEGEATGDAYGVGSYPAILLIGKDGKIAYTALGLFREELEAAIKASLAT